MPKPKRPPIVQSDGTCLLQLSRNMVAVIDGCDMDSVGHVTWYVLSSRGKFYAQRKVGPKENKATLLLHREIMKPPADMEVDHIDGDPLNNRRSNLRVVTHADNMRNIRWKTRRVSCRKTVKTMIA